jgi:hypothetical protein
MLETTNRRVIDILEKPLEQRWLHNPSGFLETATPSRFSIQVWHPELKIVKNTIIQPSANSFMTCLRGSMELRRVINTNKPIKRFIATLANKPESGQTFYNKTGIRLNIGSAWFNAKGKFYTLTSVHSDGVVILVDRVMNTPKPDKFWLTDEQTSPFAIEEKPIDVYADLVQSASNIINLMFTNYVKD